MRDIIFRGKRVDNGEWVYGSLIAMDREIDSSQAFIFTPPRASAFSCRTLVKLGMVAVDTETIGQYTGLADRNGTKIFEGDIVNVEYDIQYAGVAAERIGNFEVVFDSGCFMKKGENGLFHFIPSDVCRVIGNVCDNPELLKGGDDNACEKM